MKGTRSKSTVVLVNLGTPKALTIPAIRSFLREFLWDHRVVEIPRPIWWIILNCFVLTLRPRKIIETYKKVWTEQGSPLRVITERQVDALQTKLLNSLGEDAPTVVHAMTYGDPKIANTLDRAYQSGSRRIIVLPMYPQYSGSTTGAVYDQVAAYVQSNRALPGLTIINSYFYEPAYTAAISKSIADFWQERGRADYLLFSYHGIPISYVEKGDPYAGHCQCTTGAVSEQLQLDPERSGMSYQSLFGKAEWLKPYTAARLVELAEAGIKRVDVVCPAFAADCIETLEEIAMENADIFKNAGGEELRLIPCLNDSDSHISALEKILMPHIVAITPSVNTRCIPH
jgi:ferrochelatase|tara:strand:- start:5842 stop:6870 length:1029 start_codon:yes stop_codon:yes gene_type:complete